VRSTERLAAASIPIGALARPGACIGVVAISLLASETVSYRLGLIGVVFIGAIGLHILVNWSGELSLAHAAFIGLPAFAVAQLSVHSGVSPLLFLPVGVLVGALLGLLVAGVALRARGLQVALVTLAIGIAITRYLWTKSWVIGPSGGLRVPVPSLLGVHFTTNRSLLPVLAAVVLIAALAAGAILDSKVGRALSLVRSNPDAAAAMGIPVAFHRGMAYGIAGAFAGVAGYAYVIWVQQVSPQAFPLSLGFTYLVIAILAGKGGLTGVALSAVVLKGGEVFSIIPNWIALYVGPAALIFNVTRYQEGFNGVLREMRQRFAERKGSRRMTPDGERTSIGRRRTAVRFPVILGTVLVLAGFGALALAWYHLGNTEQVSVQNEDMVSGGLGGLALIIVGSTLLLRDALLHGRGIVEQPPDTTAGGLEPMPIVEAAPAPVARAAAKRKATPRRSAAKTKSQ
jgi:branched-chain amino acid transport system permease protein